MFLQSAASEKDKAKWSKVLIAGMMSSEESDSEDEDFIIVKPLQLHHERVALFFHRLDDAGIESKTTQAKRQQKQRTKSSVPSLRSKPLASGLPAWAFATDVD